MTFSSPKILNKLLFSLLLSAGLSSSLFAQTSIGGIINSYAKVDNIGSNYVIVNDAIRYAQFAAGDTVLLIQMKGARIYTLENASYGVLENYYGKPGTHEFLIIESVDDGLRRITFTKGIVNTFDAAGALQIIKVPSYRSAVVNGSDLTCMPWDSTSGTGGVLSVIVIRTLSLNRNIDVSGKGFAGGIVSLGAGICVQSDATNLDKYAFDISNNNSGYKGESPVIRGYLDIDNYPPIFPGYARGKGVNFSGGGGGNGRFSGGGGGGNYGAGGKGGREMASCTPFPVDGGLGGKSYKTTPLEGGIFLGSGGGSSTYLDGSVASAGGSGGGIVIIICDTIAGNGRSIIANGSSPAQTSLNAGAGGGGGGGAVAISLNSFSSSSTASALTISATGGKGGNNAGTFGEGGGGGGGLIKVSNISIPANVTRTVTGGTVGSRSGGSTGGNGAAGESSTPFNPLMTGFLLNSITSSVSGNQTDSICSGDVPQKINGSIPVGGSGLYSYLWQKSYDPNGTAVNIPSSDTRDLIPSDIETDTVWFRRIIRDNVSLNTDTSKWVKIIVQPAITGNLVGKDTTICYNQNPLALVATNGGPSGGNGIYEYRWVQNDTNSGWDSAPSATGTNINAAYDPPSLAATTYYRRIVSSGRCVNFSPEVKITVLSLITGNNMVRTDSVICEGSLFVPLSASAPAGGDLIYKYQWQDSTSSGKWSAAGGINSGQDYSVDTSAFSITVSRFYRRVVFSGPDSVCRNFGSTIVLTRFHKITNNLIKSDTTICSGVVPFPLRGSLPGNGSGSYTYEWQDSTRSGVWSSRSTAGFSYSPSALTDTTWYRRIVTSSLCVSKSTPVRINVHKPVVNNTIALLYGNLTDTTLCSGAIPHIIKGTAASGGTNIPGDYAYLWMSSADNSTWSPITGGTGINYQPAALTATTYYRRQVISGACTSLSQATVKINVLPPISNNIISPGQSVCYSTAPSLLGGADLSGGAGPGTYSFFWEQSADGTSWSAAAGENNSASGTYQPPVLKIPMRYRRTVKSGENGCCSNISNVINIGIRSLPTGTITTTSDTAICEGTKVRLKVHLTGASKWKISYLENSSKGAPVEVAGADTTLMVTPLIASSMATVSYSLDKVEDKYGCVATVLSGTRRVDVYKVPSANAGPDEIVCGPKATLNAVPGIGTGKWYFPAAVLSSTVNAPTVTVTIDSLFQGKSTDLKFVWEEVNWQCSNRDSATVTFNKRVSAVNAGNDTTLYSFDHIFHLVASPLPDWEKGAWSVVSGTGDFDDNTNNHAIVSDLSEGTNTFLWSVTNGNCMAQDMVTVNVSDLVIPEGFSPNNDPGNYNNTFIISGLDLANQNADLKIVNGAGVQVFSTSNRDGEEWKEWDGKNSRGIDLPEGTYYYLLRITSKGNGQVFKKSGFIILKRY
jgi:hypothetical protein